MPVNGQRPPSRDFYQTSIWLHKSWIAKHKHEGEAATWAGNSPNVIHRHYKGLVKEADAHEFWAITPDNVKSEIVTFPGKAEAVAA